MEIIRQQHHDYVLRVIGALPPQLFNRTVILRDVVYMVTQTTSFLQETPRHRVSHSPIMDFFYNACVTIRWGEPQVRLELTMDFSASLQGRCNGHYATEASSPPTWI